MTIVPIVEGYGDVKAVPVLLRRLSSLAIAQIRIGRPWRFSRTKLADEVELKRIARAASLQEDCAAVVVILDEDDDLACELGPRVATWLREELPAIPTGVTIARREMESWFLGAIESLRGRRGISADAQLLADPESIRNAKKELEQTMARGRSYHETADQAAFADLMDMQLAFRNCSSFRKLVRDLNRILVSLNASQALLPPEGWEA
jgi:hypothetical protein